MKNVEYTVIRTKRRTLSLEVGPDGRVTVRSPLNMPEKTIEDFVNDHKIWLEKALLKQAERSRLYPEPDGETAARLQKKAREVIPRKVAEYEAKTGLKAAGVKITSAGTRFGSCNSKNGLCFSWRLMQYPEEAIDYVVVHELAHTVHHNHSKAFWALVERHMPDYKRRRSLLK